MKKRVLSLFMAFTLCFSMQPTTVLAEETSVAAEQKVQNRESTTEVYTTGVSVAETSAVEMLVIMSMTIVSPW